LRLDNENRISKLDTRDQALQDEYLRAVSAAQNLESYPNYRCLSQVQQAKSSFVSVEQFRAEATTLNSMETQKFNDASWRLAEAEKVKAASEAQFEEAIRSWQDIQAAIQSIPSARNQADSSISSAHSHISAYSHNGQSQARSYLDDAETAYDQGNALISSDPPQALAHFQKADNDADSAYSAVDTSDDTSTTTSSGGWGSGSSGDSGGYSSGGGGFRRRF
jgi:uncharacterized membrane protein YgcG